MTEYRFAGTTQHTFPTYSHPEREGVLQADPDEIIDFGDAEPPEGPLWQAQDADGNWVAREPGPSRDLTDPEAEEALRKHLAGEDDEPAPTKRRSGRAQPDVSPRENGDTKQE